MPRHMIWGERRRREPHRPEIAPPLAPISGDPHRSRHVALTVFYNGACPICRRHIARYQAASAGRSRLIAWCDAAAAPWALKRWHVEPDDALLRLYIVDADGRLLAGAAAFARLWRALPGYRAAGLLAGLPGVGLLIDAFSLVHLAVAPGIAISAVPVRAMHRAGRLARTSEPAVGSAALRSNTIAADSTFRRLLGEAAWQRLNPNVRARFAVKPDVGQVLVFSGAMDVVRRSWFGWLLGHICRLIGSPVTPRQGRHVPTAVRIYRSSHRDGIVWERRYDFSGRAPVVVTSTKRADPPDGLLECASRGFAMRLRLFERDGAIHFASTGYCFELGRWRLPIPSLLTPGAAHVIHSDEGNGWFRFTMTFRHRLFGETYFQQGLFHQADDTP